MGNINIGGRLHSTAAGNVVAGANEILDDTQNKKQNVINSEVNVALTNLDGRIDTRIATAKSEIIGDAASDYNTLGKLEDKIQAEASRATAAEGTLSSGKADKATTLSGYGITDAYTKTEVNDLVDTPHQNYVTVDTYADLANIASPSDDTIYRVSSYNGSTSQVDITKYSEYAWNGTQFVFLSVKNQVDEVFDISEYNASAKYADLAAALGTNGVNVPASVRKGGMSVKYVNSSDNKYVQYRFTATNTDNYIFVNLVNWEIQTIDYTNGITGTLAYKVRKTNVNNPETIFYASDVTVGEELFYEINSPTASKAFYLELLDSSSQRIAVYGRTASSMSDGVYKGSFVVPDGFNLCRIVGSDVAGTVSVMKKFNNNILDNRLSKTEKYNGVYDVSALNGGASYASLSNVFSSIPVNDRLVGMTIRFKNTSGVYEQWRYTSSIIDNGEFIKITNWQGADDVLTGNSNNLAKSGLAYEKYAEYYITSGFNIKNIQGALNNYCWAIVGGSVILQGTGYQKAVNALIDATNINCIKFKSLTTAGGVDVCFVAAFDENKQFLIDESLHVKDSSTSTHDLTWEKGANTKYISIGWGTYTASVKIDPIPASEKYVDKATGVICENVNALDRYELFNINDVSVGETLYYEIDSPSSSKYCFIELLDSSNQRIAVYGRTASSMPAGTYSDKFVVPSNFSRCILCRNDNLNKVSIYEEKNNVILSESSVKFKEQQGFLYESDNAWLDRNTSIFTIDDVSVGDYIYYELHGVDNTAFYLELLDESNQAIAYYGKTSSFSELRDNIGYFFIPYNFHHLTIRFGGNVAGDKCKILKVQGQVFGIVNNNKTFDIDSRMVDNDTNTNNRYANPKMETLSSWNSKHSESQIQKESVFNSQTPFTIDGESSGKFRIPACCITNSGTYLVVAENRAGNGDDNAKMQYVLARKASNSDEWDRSILVPFDLVNNYRPINPSFIIDRTGAHGVVGRIFFFFGWGEYGFWTQKGGEGSYIYSDDDGVTWSERVSLAQYAPSGYEWSIASNSNGIQLADGTLIMPAQYYGQGKHSGGILYKKVGENWAFSKALPNTGNFSECVVYQREDNNIILNIRNESGGLGSVHRKSFIYNDDWIDENVTFNYRTACQGAIIKTTINSRVVYLMTFPDSKQLLGTTSTDRGYQTIWVSYDSKKWIRCFRLVDGLNLGYSCIDYYDGKLIVAFENSLSLDIAFEDLTPLLSNFIISSTQTEINKPAEDRIQELMERVLALESN